MVVSMREKGETSGVKKKSGPKQHKPMQQAQQHISGSPNTITSPMDEVALSRTFGGLGHFSQKGSGSNCKQ